MTIFAKATEKKGGERESRQISFFCLMDSGGPVSEVEQETLSESQRLFLPRKKNLQMDKIPDVGTEACSMIWTNSLTVDKATFK